MTAIANLKRMVAVLENLKKYDARFITPEWKVDVRGTTMQLSNRVYSTKALGPIEVRIYFDVDNKVTYSLSVTLNYANTDDQKNHKSLSHDIFTMMEKCLSGEAL